jgi:hypothetical protein
VGGQLLALAAVIGLGVANTFASPSPAWASAAFPIKADTETVETHIFDPGGHAAPFLVDLDGDGRRDLVVGGIGGRFRFFPNTNTDAEPRFEGGSRWLLAEGVPAQVRNWCCMAAAPQFVDLDADGIVDLTAGSYGGPSYWFRGVGDGSFKLPHQLLEWRGHTLLAREDIFSQRTTTGRLDGQLSSYAANLAWTKWNGDEQWDLLIGNHYGQLFVFRGGPGRFGPPGLPEFARMSLDKARLPANELAIGGMQVLPQGDEHAAPAVADWDGDGLWDILLGSKSGNVYLLKNSGSPHAPEFKSRELILKGGQGTQLLVSNNSPGFGIRTQVHATDYNNDGKMDLLVGCFVASVSLRSDLTSEQRANAMAIWTELEQIDSAVGNVHREVPGKFAPYFEPSNKSRYDRTQELTKQLHPFLNQHTVKTETGKTYETDTINHGNVWVFLRK